MIQITPQMRILLAVEPVDFRKGIDGLVALCGQKLQSEPFEGALFVFSSRRRKSLKILVYDGQGFWLCQKRLSEGCFKWWPQNSGPTTRQLDAHQLQLLLWNGDPTASKAAPMWRRVTPATTA
jgi:transposase